MSAITTSSASMTWSRVGRSARGLAAHGLLFCFALSLALKVDDRTSFSCWLVHSLLAAVDERHHHLLRFDDVVPCGEIGEGAGCARPPLLLRPLPRPQDRRPHLLLLLLLWIILVASFAALIIQSLAAKLGVVTGKHLAEHCRAEYSWIPNFILWVLTEIAVIPCDIPEVIGSAFALNMLFNITVWCGVLITGLSTLVFLLLQHYRVRKLEFLIALLVFTMATCFFGELAYAKPKASEVLKGLFVPELKGNGATGLSISLLGAMVMPHNLFLRSALVLSRKVPCSLNGIKEACRFYTIESAFALTVAFFINVSIISVSGAICSSTNLDPDDKKNCLDLDLNKASFLLEGIGVRSFLLLLYWHRDRAL